MSKSPIQRPAMPLPTHVNDYDIRYYKGSIRYTILFGRTYRLETLGVHGIKLLPIISPQDEYLKNKAKSRIQHHSPLKDH